LYAPNTMQPLNICLIHDEHLAHLQFSLLFVRSQMADCFTTVQSIPFSISLCESCLQ
jgi:hypothetical protein